jgi:glyoxylase-like metal-dependent hydrolase (beta-lactamase superfamily II)
MVKSLYARKTKALVLILTKTSHAHWDHIFPAGNFFPNAKVLCGSGTLEWASKSWPSEADSTFDGRIWNKESSELPVEELPSPKASPEKWQPLGPFKNAYDFFGDGSFWLIDAPGHCPGNLAALARVKRKDGKVKWAFLGGDCFHSHLFVDYPEAPFGKGVKVTPTDTFHEHEEDAREIIRQTAELKKGEGENALIWIAHTGTLEDIWNF